MSNKLYLGTPGDMRELPIPDMGWNVQHQRFSSLARSVNGAGTEVLMGSKKQYSLSFTLSTESELAWLEQCWWGDVLPLWFVDPLVSNRLSATTAASGGTPKGIRDFRNTGGALQIVKESAGPTFPRFSAQLKAGTAISTPDVPVIPGEQLTASVRLHGTQSVTPKVYWKKADGSSLSTSSGTAVAAGSSFTLASVTADTPTGAAWAAFSLEAASSGDITTTAWALTPGADALWQPGGGAIEVAMTEFSGTSPFYPYKSVTISFEEL